ncbi:ATP-binding protein [Streptomyces vastus]|uniref:ATP-binding protein n=1 Tax=Streptomyces vastus TaxID=285451 RepID=UPI0031D19B7C
MGRRREREALSALVDTVRAGESRALVVTGESGVGKTALLDWLVAETSGVRIVRATGVQAEMDLPFAALHQLLAPMLDRLNRPPRLSSCGIVGRPGGAIMHAAGRASVTS